MLDAHAFNMIWQFVQAHWHTIADPIALGAGTETGKQALVFIKDRLTRTDDGKRVIDAAIAAPEDSQAMENVRSLLHRTLIEDPQFASGLQERLQQVNVQIHSLGANANIVSMGNMAGGTINLNRGREQADDTI
jgi:hypothetical protein